LASTAVAGGQVQFPFTNFAGMPGGPGSVDWIGSAARFGGPAGVAVDKAGNVYVADTFNNRITKGTPVAAPGALQFVTSSGTLAVSNGLVRMRLTGSSGSNVVLEVSANLQAWAPVQTNALPPADSCVNLLTNCFPLRWR
jgi:hypothetical protein